MHKILYISITLFLLSACAESKANRKLPGQWNIMSHSFVDEFGFTTECELSTGTLVLGDCKDGDCSYTFNYNYPCILSGANSEMGAYTISEGGEAFVMIRENMDATTDTIENTIVLLTSTDLKLNYYVPTTKRRHLVVFSR